MVESKFYIQLRKVDYVFFVRKIVYDKEEKELIDIVVFVFVDFNKMNVNLRYLIGKLKEKNVLELKMIFKGYVDYVFFVCSVVFLIKIILLKLKDILYLFYVYEEVFIKIFFVSLNFVLSFRRKSEDKFLFGVIYFGNRIKGKEGDQYDNVLFLFLSKSLVIIFQYSFDIIFVFLEVEVEVKVFLEEVRLKFVFRLRGFIFELLL